MEKKELKKKIFDFMPLILMVGLAFFLRAYKAEELFNYAHDNDLASWIVKDILVNHHIRLAGQQTSIIGVFIGALFYYLQIPFYLLGGMDPRYVVYLSVFLGTLAAFSFYYVFSHIFNRKIGLIAALIYATSPLIVFTDREVVPTMPLMLWTVWFFYDLFLVYKGDQKKGFILFAFLLALVWHINLSLYLVCPLILLAFVFSGRRMNGRYLLLGITVALVLNLPLIIFESRHNFQQTKAVAASIISTRGNKENTINFGMKLDRVMQLVEKNVSSLVFPFFSPPSYLALGLIFIFLIVLLVTGKISLKLFSVFGLWQLLFIVFFTFNSINLSEYYLNGMNVIWIAIVSLFLGFLFDQSSFFKYAALILFVFYIIRNVGLILNTKSAGIGYLQRKAIVAEIDKDAKAHNYPCVSVSYITSPGYDLGYRYFFYLNKMHVNQPKSGSPVYTIVFPLSLVDKVDRRFGSLGLILPDYKRYNEKDVLKSCQGENSNLTDPMLGYTE